MCTIFRKSQENNPFHVARHARIPGFYGNNKHVQTVCTRLYFQGTRLFFIEDYGTSNSVPNFLPRVFSATFALTISFMASTCSLSVLFWIQNVTEALQNNLVAPLHIVLYLVSHTYFTSDAIEGASPFPCRPPIARIEKYILLTRLSRDSN